MCGTPDRDAPHRKMCRYCAVTIAVALFALPQLPVTFTQYGYVPVLSFGVVNVGVFPPTFCAVLPLWPLYHWYDSVPVPVAVTLSVVVVFLGIVTLCGCCVIVVAGLTVTFVAADVALQPLAFVTVTVYAPLAVALIDCVVAPVDHRYVKPAGAVSATLPPAQNVVGPPAVMVGAGFAFTVTTVAAEVPLQPVASVTVTLYEPDALTAIDCVVAPVLQ